jgi:hypothetical protein
MAPDCKTEYGQVQIVTSDGSMLVYNLVDYGRLQPSGASTTNGLYDIVSGAGRFADFTAGRGIFSIDEHPDGLAFLALSGNALRDQMREREIITSRDP